MQSLCIIQVNWQLVGRKRKYFICIIHGMKLWQTPWGSEGSVCCRCLGSPSPSQSISIMFDGRQVIAQVWPCPVSFLTADCVVAPYANLESPRFSSQAPYGQPSLHSISRAWAESRSGPGPQPSWSSPGSATGHVLPTASCPPWVRGCNSRCLPASGWKQLLITVWGNASVWRGDDPKSLLSRHQKPGITVGWKTVMLAALAWSGWQEGFVPWQKTAVKENVRRRHN